MKEEEVVISVLTIQGLVQGVGFRSFIYRIASEMNICGEVDNRNNGVCIRATLTPVQRELFIERIRREHPKVASIHRITVSERIEVRNPYMGFSYYSQSVGIGRGDAGCSRYCRLSRMLT